MEGSLVNMDACALSEISLMIVGQIELTTFPVERRNRLLCDIPKVLMPAPSGYLPPRVLWVGGFFLS